MDVVLDDDGDNVMLTVRDNGIGPVADPFALPNCHGLRLLRERARFLGGALTLEPGEQGGAVLTMILPKQAPAG